MIAEPLVSIIVPCYNSEEFIEDCVNSLMQQTYKNLEFILVNDGSKDNTLNVIRQFGLKDSRIRIFSQENMGPSAARNTGIENACGDFIYFLDQDDVLKKDAIDTLVSTYKNNDIITGVTRSFTVSNNEFVEGPILGVPKERDITFKNDNYEVLIRAMEAGLTPVLHNKLYRKEFIDRYNLRFKFGNFHEDELWFFETMLYARNVKFIDKETYLYRVDNQSSITKNMGDKNLKSYIEVMEIVLEKYGKEQRYSLIANWYAVYLKKLFIDFAIRDRSKLSEEAISKLEAALKNNYKPLGDVRILSRSNDLYYRCLNTLSRQDFIVIKKYFFRNPINSLRKAVKTFKILYTLKDDANK